MRNIQYDPRLKIRGVEFEEGNMRGSHIDKVIMDVSCNVTGRSKIADKYIKQ